MSKRPHNLNNFVCTTHLCLCRLGSNEMDCLSSNSLPANANFNVSYVCSGAIRKVWMYSAVECALSANDLLCNHLSCPIQFAVSPNNDFLTQLPQDTSLVMKSSDASTFFEGRYESLLNISTVCYLWKIIHATLSQTYRSKFINDMRILPPHLPLASATGLPIH